MCVFVGGWRGEGGGGQVKSSVVSKRGRGSLHIYFVLKWSQTQFRKWIKISHLNNERSLINKKT